MCRFLASGALAACIACTPASGDSGVAAVVDPLCDQGYELTWASWGEAYFGTYCDACHAADSPNRFGAPEGISFDTVAEARTWAPRIRARVLDDQTMPLGGGVNENDLYLLDVYLTCRL
jgi:cytochrome c5